MPRSIVVGSDGSQGALDALALGRWLAELFSARLEIVVAYATKDFYWSSGTHDPPPQVESALEAARLALRGVNEANFRSVASPSAAGALHLVAEQIGAELIVVGSSHRGTLGRVFLGTVTQQTLDTAPCPVAVAPAGLQPLDIGRTPRVGVGFDDSTESRNALVVGHELARRMDAMLEILWVANLAMQALPFAAFSYLEPNYFAEVRSSFEERVQTAVAQVHDGVPIRTRIVSGRATDELAEASSRLDLLVLGSRGYGPLRRVLLGSVSRQLLGVARCPVVVVPRGSRSLFAKPGFSDPAQQTASQSAQGRGETARHARTA